MSSLGRILGKRCVKRREKTRESKNERGMGPEIYGSWSKVLLHLKNNVELSGVLPLMEQ